MTDGFASFLQTVLWVSLWTTILWLYHEPIGALLEALKQRVDSGGAIKFGPVEMAALRSQGPEEQINKLNSEVAEIVNAESEADKVDVAETHQNADDIRAQYLSAEDLALREIQSEYGIPIGRQIALGHDLGVDGFFASGGRAHIVEVKLLGRLYFTTLLVAALDRIISQLYRSHWRNVEIILAVVFNSDEVDLDRERSRITAALDGRDDVTIRCYHLSALARKYGATAILR